MRATDERWASLLDAAYAAYHLQVERHRDPIDLVYRYDHPEDREIVAFLVSSLSYGNVTTICTSATRLLGFLGERPAETLKRRDDFPELAPFRHRFTTGDDLRVVLAVLAAVVRNHGSLEKFFLAAGKDSVSSQERLERFVDAIRDTPVPAPLARHRALRSRSMKYLLPSPREGSACKRLNMFLRWVVRPADGIDLGLWTNVDPAGLFLPVDTHILQVLRRLRWTDSKTANWRVCVAATERLRRIDPRDPIRFDFSLCHLSMAGDDVRRFHGASSK
jgi:uncharacterized protein (TIGR02757 family)